MAIRQIGNCVLFPEEGAIVGRIAAARNIPCDAKKEVDGGTLVQMPWGVDACRILYNAGLTEAIELTPFMYDENRPLVEGRFQPLTHQLVTASFMTCHPVCYVLSEPRLGKTGSTILAMDWLQRNRLVTGGVLVITTYTTLRSVWMESLSSTLPRAVVREVHGPRREEALLDPADFYVTNYDSVRLSERAFRQAVTEGRIGAIVVDELTHVGNATSLRSKAISGLCRTVPRVVGLTGSPADNLEAVFGMAKCVNPARLPCTTFTSWRDRVMFKYGFQAWMWRPRTDAAATVFRTLQPAVRYKKEDVLDLPPVTEQIRRCDLSSEQTDALDALKAEAIAFLDSGGVVTAANGGVMVQRAMQIAQGIVKTDDGTIHELDHSDRTQTILDAIAETNRKVVVYSPFIAGCEMLAQEISKAGHSCQVITGSVSGAKRAQILKAFQEEDNPRVLVCHPITVGFGTELSRADTMVFSVPLLLGGFVYNQALERLSSVRQTASNINIIHVVSTDMEREALRKLQQGHALGQIVASFFEWARKKSHKRG